MIRSNDDIGAGLAAARDPRPIRLGERLHVVGIAGAGASAAAFLAAKAGAIVSGCDPGGPSPYTVALEKAGVPMDWAHDPGHVTTAPGSRPDRLAVTKALTSVDPDHPELLAARALRLPVEPWQQTVADVAATTGQRLVAVAGTHGKSTTAGWLVHVLVEAGHDPSAFVGALLGPAITGDVPATARWGRGDAFVVEADEYAGNFDPYRPAIAILLNAEWDHPDVFPDEAAVILAFERWIRSAGAEHRTLIANIGDPGVARLVERLGDWPGRTIAIELHVGDFGTSHQLRSGDGMLVGSLEQDGSLQAFGAGGAFVRTPALSIAGRHNGSNALAVVAAALELGVPAGSLAASLGTFRGVGRRMELKGEPGGVVVIDDYAHHPSAIEATLAAVRSRYPERRVWAVYEPLTYHRTARMLDRFAEVLATADRAVIADIWPGRDPDTSITSAAALATAVTDRAPEPATAPGSVEETADHLLGRVAGGDVVLVMGGGRSYVIADRLVAALAERWRP